MEEKKIVGNRFKYYRNNILKMSQMKLGEILEMQQANIARIENGDSFPTIPTIIKMNSLYGLNVEWLITGVGTDYDMSEEYTFVPNKAKNSETELLVNDNIKLLSQVNEVQAKYITLLERGIGAKVENDSLKNDE